MEDQILFYLDNNEDGHNKEKSSMKFLSLLLYVLCGVATEEDTEVESASGGAGAGKVQFQDFHFS